jgi:hypothetical protein
MDGAARPALYVPIFLALLLVIKHSKQIIVIGSPQVVNHGVSGLDRPHF